MIIKIPFINSNEILNLFKFIIILYNSFKLIFKKIIIYKDSFPLVKNINLF